MKWFHKIAHCSLGLLIAMAMVAVGVSGQDPAAPKKIDPNKINLNQATVEELRALPGIGPVIARSIVEHREVVGPFRSIEESMAVPGIGRKTFAKIREQVTVEEVQVPPVPSPAASDVPS